jgi:general L-amino acid transport system substrate-binding protein
VISRVGNYREIFDRNLGPTTPLGMDRGMNRLWSDGGLMYSPPFR